MSFEKGWFLHKMNQHAPAGYRFVAIGKEGRIAMFAPEFMNRDNMSGPFVSNISFDVLNGVFGGLLTKRSDKIHQGLSVLDYRDAFDIVEPDMSSLSKQEADAQRARYASYVSTVHRQRRAFWPPIAPFMYKNAVLVQGLSDSGAEIPEFLRKRLVKYVNDCVWYAVLCVFGSMSIGDMCYYQDEYRKRMQELGIVPGQEFGLFSAMREARTRQIMDIECKIDDLKFDALPRQKQELDSVVANRPDDTDSHDQAQTRVCETLDQIEQLSRSRDALEPKPKHQPACDILYNEFHDEVGNPIVPKLGDSALAQFVKLAMMRTEKVK